MSKSFKKMFVPLYMLYAIMIALTLFANSYGFMCFFLVMTIPLVLCFSVASYYQGKYDD
jgi:hypothetical protein